MSTTLTAGGGEAPPRHSTRELWLITLGHALTHWYPATFYLLLPIIGNELGLSFSTWPVPWPTCPAARSSTRSAARAC